jgi:hypothetical protein
MRSLKYMVLFLDMEGRIARMRKFALSITKEIEKMCKSVPSIPVYRPSCFVRTLFLRGVLSENEDHAKLVDRHRENLFDKDKALLDETIAFFLL